MTKNAETLNAKPFVKWVGGKSQLIPVISQKYPKNLKKYCEPFVGGGAVLFDVLNNFTPESVIINDINSELINTYKVVKNNVNDLITVLTEYQNFYLEKDEEGKKEYFYNQRALFNRLELNEEDLNIEKAALFIFLNKTCFNGIYRVNSKGLFNVPWNQSKKAVICDEKNLQNCSILLQNVTILCGNYKECKKFIDKDTFVYFDPPYKPITKSSSFTAYNENGFGDKEQEDLANFIKDLANDGIKILASNSDPKNSNPDDNYFDDLYKGLSIERVSALRMVNSKASNRGAINEILISN